jgi:hypothetical protein
MQMGMMTEGLSPTVQDAEKPELRSQVLRICCNRLQGFRRSAEQQTVHLAFILESQCGQLFWQSKHDMEVLARQKFGLTLLQPLGSGQGLALGAMPIGAGVVCVTFVPALVTLFEMAAERRCTALFDGAQHPLLSGGQRFGMCPAKLVTMGAHDIGDFQCRPHGPDRALRLRISHGVRKKI